MELFAEINCGAINKKWNMRASGQLSLSLCGRYKTLNPIMCLGVSKVIECFHLCHVRITFCVHHILWFGVDHLLHLQCNIHIYVSCIYTQTVQEYNFSCVEIVQVVLFIDAIILSLV